MLALPGMPRQQNPQVAQVVPRGPGFESITERDEEWISIEFLERCSSIESFRLRSLHCGSIDYRSRRRTISIHAVRSRAEYRDVFSRNLLHTRQRKLLIASTDTAVDRFHGHFPAGDQAHAFV